MCSSRDRTLSGEKGHGTACPSIHDISSRDNSNKRGRQGVHHLLDRRRLSGIAYMNLVAQSVFRDGGSLAQVMWPYLPSLTECRRCFRSSDCLARVSASLDHMKILHHPETLVPKCPHTVLHAVVNPESWIPRRGEEVTPCVAAVA